MKVCVFQCPNGTFESSLCLPRPRLARPSWWSFRSRPQRPAGADQARMIALARLRSIPRALMSGRSCSLARRVFFEAIADARSADVKARRDRPSRRWRRPFGRQLRHRDVGLLGDRPFLQKKRPMRFELGVAASAAGHCRRRGFAAHARPSRAGCTTNETVHPEMHRGRVATNDLHRQSGQRAHADQANTASASRITSFRK